MPRMFWVMQGCTVSISWRAGAELVFAVFSAVIMP